MIYIFLVGRGKMNFGFDGSDIESSSVNPLAKSDGKKLIKGKTRASSSLPEKRTRGAETTVSNRPKKTSGERSSANTEGSCRQISSIIDERGFGDSTSSVPSSSAKEPHETGSPPFSQAKFLKGTRTRFCWKEGLPANFPDSVVVSPRTHNHHEVGR
jgi:hypothetical protein